MGQDAAYYRDYRARREAENAPERERAIEKALTCLVAYEANRNAMSRASSCPHAEKQRRLAAQDVSLGLLVCTLRNLLRHGLAFVDNPTSGRRATLDDSREDVIFEWLPGRGPVLGADWPVLDGKPHRASLVTQHRKMPGFNQVEKEGG